MTRRNSWEIHLQETIDKLKEENNNLRKQLTETKEELLSTIQYLDDAQNVNEELSDELARLQSLRHGRLVF